MSTDTGRPLDDNGKEPVEGRIDVKDTCIDSRGLGPVVERLKDRSCLDLLQPILEELHDIKKLLKKKTKTVCKKCEGRGTIKVPKSIDRVRCPSCHGTGYEPEED